jgi:hypothetical protein
MGNNKLLRKWILISGIIISIIAIIHNIMGILMYPDMMKAQTIQKLANGFVYFFILGGTSFLFAALLMLFSLKGLKKSEKWAWTQSFCSAIFISLTQVGALTFGKFRNPLIYIVAVCSISSIVILILNIKNFKNEKN